MTERVDGLVVALVADLVFGSKIGGTAQHCGVAVRIVRTSDDLSALLPAARLALVDLNVETERVLDLARSIRERSPRPMLVGFVSHVQTELFAAARDAGFDRVLARSKFVHALPELLTRSEPRP